MNKQMNKPMHKPKPFKHVLSSVCTAESRAKQTNSLNQYNADLCELADNAPMVVKSIHILYASQCYRLAPGARGRRITYAL